MQKTTFKFKLKMRQNFNGDFGVRLNFEILNGLCFLLSRMAYAQVKQFGFNESIGPVSFDPSEEEETGLKPYSKKLQATMDLEARKLVSEAYQRTEELLKDNSKALAKVGTT